MELRHLRTFEAVARTLSVTQAARELHYAQSSVSDQIQALERELGVELINRSQRRIRLTAQGEVLSSYTGRILTLLEEARFAVARPAAELSLGALETLSRHLLPRVLAHYRELHPETKVRVSQDNRGALYRAVRSGDLDLCLTFGASPAAPGLCAETLAEEPLVVIVPPEHPLAARGRADLAELAAEPFLATQRGCGFREMYDGALGAVAGREPVAEVDGIGTLGACVAAEMGCALLPLVAVRELAERGEVALVEVDGADLRTAVTMTWLERNATAPQLTGFRDAVRARLAA
ncbi:LysR family transcriptional regulator [Kitasatospora sp. NPDC004272]